MCLTQLELTNYIMKLYKSLNSTLTNFYPKFRKLFAIMNGMCFNKNKLLKSKGISIQSTKKLPL